MSVYEDFASVWCRVVKKKHLPKNDFFIKGYSFKRLRIINLLDENTKLAKMKIENLCFYL